MNVERQHSVIGSKTVESAGPEAFPLRAGLRGLLRRKTARILLPVIIFAALLTGILFALRPAVESAPTAAAAEDAALQQAAVKALAGRDGTVIIMDPQTGRIRALVNPQLAFESELMPGSTIKPFTALTALRTGALTADSRLLCRQQYAHANFRISCVHPPDKPAFNAEQALAYSCNYFYARLGEHLSASAFNATLGSFGFGKRTGAGGTKEADGQLPRGPWEARNAIGEAPTELVTPIQLITGYTALMNGGHLFTPTQAAANGFKATTRREIKIDDDARALIIRGMRGAVEYGTAAPANLTQNPNYIFGKTGTSDLVDGIGMQGWFVGFAAPRSADGAAPAPDSLGLVVLVFIKGANGKESAMASRTIFDEFARMGSRGDTGARGRNEQQRLEPAARETGTQTVRVHLVTQNETREIPLEEYVLGVVAAEGSIEPEVESLKALAIAARTYAVQHLHRHEKDGYDLCSTTHCQRFIPTGATDATAAAKRAVNETRGQVLVDQNGKLIDAYFSASCGGATADVHDLWGSSPRSYLRSNPDQFCRTEAHAEWTDNITNADLARALAVDPRTDVGPHINALTISKRDPSGRAEFIAIAGNRNVTVRGWDFKLIVGRTLGWNWLKSSRFTINRSGDGFTFNGSGFGHGLGLCQEGAHVMAERGARFQQILDQYFPGTRVAVVKG
jgi:SpoIID/LytB domain protein